jgi:1-aminocyclopropane-1-carboxylate deaminase/D-cysteine desulfhydrase-like pyridoxal-dependent ACC family enzyme
MFDSSVCTSCPTNHTVIEKIQERLDIEVVVIPCVGDEVYAQRQMINLNVQVLGHNIEKHQNNVPTILRPTPIHDGITTRNQKQIVDESITKRHDYYRFGEPHADILQTFREFRDEYDILIDLLYGAPCWTILFRHWTSSIMSSTFTTTTTSMSSTPTTSAASDNNNSRRDPNPTFNPLAPLDGRRIMYVHSGGVEGINSQLLRYKHQNLIGIDEIQLPGRNTK